MTLDDLIIREAQDADLDALLALEQEIIEAERPFNTAIKSQDAYYYDLKKLMVEEDSRLVVGQVLDSIVATGYAQIRHSKPSLKHERHGYLGFMFVAEAYRGLGLNKLILQELIAWGQAQGVHDFYLDVYADNSPAIRAYEKFGFAASKLEMTLSLE